MPVGPFRSVWAYFCFQSDMLSLYRIIPCKELDLACEPSVGCALRSPACNLVLWSALFGHAGGPDSIVCRESCLRVERFRELSSITFRESCFLLSKASRPNQGSRGLHILWARLALSEGVNRQGCEVRHPFMSNC
jgi:hypothetical protein